MSRRVSIITCFFILLSFFTFNEGYAQSPADSLLLKNKEMPKSSDEQLAAQYFQNKEYDKAVVHYERLFDKNQTVFYYNYYLNCLLELSEFKKAEKVVKRQIKRSPESMTYKVDLGYIYKTANETSNAKKEFEGAISSLAPNQAHIFELANAFINRKELDYALDTYLKGRKLLKDAYPFNFEVAEIYAQKGDFTAMINEYLDVLLINEAYLQQVQNYLLRIYQSDPSENKNQLLKAQLLKRVQKYHDKTVYSEMLIWIFIQEKDFNSAFIQSKALDKRLNEDGGRLVTLAQMSLSNSNYEVAIKSYQYIIEKGKDNYYYINSKMELLNVMNRKIIEHAGYTQADLLELEKNYLLTITELGKHGNTAPLLKELAHLYAFYLNNTEKAILLLEEAIALPGINLVYQAKCKLELGDILLMTDEIWEASLYYSQVDKAFKHDPMGDEAKLRNARLSYFVGDFSWAQAQLDVLKGSTSKLIANDAMKLSLLITDNSTIDTATAPLMLYAHADLLAFQNKDDLALITLDSINTLFPAHALADDILFKKAKIMEKRQDYETAAKYLQNIVDAYNYDILADDALFRLAELNQFHFNNIEKAKELYQKILVDYAGSLYTVEARKRFRELRGDRIN